MTCLALILSLLVAAPRLVNYSAADGLTSNTVYAIVQDTDGILWAGTRNGLGLVITRELLGKLGASMDMHNRAEGGLEITITL